MTSKAMGPLLVSLAGTESLSVDVSSPQPFSLAACQRHQPLDTWIKANELHGAGHSWGH